MLIRRRVTQIVLIKCQRMTTIMVMSTRSLASVKAQFSAVVDSVHDTHERVVVTRNGEPAVAVIAIDDLESL